MLSLNTVIGLSTLQYRGLALAGVNIPGIISLLVGLISPKKTTLLIIRTGWCSHGAKCAAEPWLEMGLRHLGSCSTNAHPLYSLCTPTLTMGFFRFLSFRLFSWLRSTSIDSAKLRGRKLLQACQPECCGQLCSSRTISAYVS
jgi:hypothetical protein